MRQSRSIDKMLRDEEKRLSRQVKASSLWFMPSSSQLTIASLDYRCYYSVCLSCPTSECFRTLIVLLACFRPRLKRKVDHPRTFISDTVLLHRTDSCPIPQKQMKVRSSPALLLRAELPTHGQGAYPLSSTPPRSSTSKVSIGQNSNPTANRSLSTSTKPCPSLSRSSGRGASPSSTIPTPWVLSLPSNVPTDPNHSL